VTSRGLCLFGLLQLAWTPITSAQVRAHVDLGAGGDPVSGGGRTSLWSIAPALAYQVARLRLEAAGEYRDFGDLSPAASGFAAASYLAGGNGPVLGEIVATARFLSGPLTEDGVAWEGGGRLHLRKRQAGLWVGSEAGHDLHGATLRWEAAAWRRFGQIALQLQGSQTAAVDPGTRKAGGLSDTLAPQIDTLGARQVRTITDLGVWLHWSPPRVDLALALGRRYGFPEVAGGISLGDGLGQNSPGETATRSDWWLADLTYWLTPRLGLNGRIGHSPADPQWGVAGGAFLRVAVRAVVGRGGSGPRLAESRATGFAVRRLAGNPVAAQFTLNGARGVERVELMGDFTDWSPVEMQRTGEGRWELRLGLKPGLHFVNVRYDGGPWRPPPGTRVITDEFERLTGVVVVE
jgi:hypothetical protein